MYQITGTMEIVECNTKAILDLFFGDAELNAEDIDSIELEA